MTDPAFILPVRWPLVPVDVAAFYLNREPDEIVRGCDSWWAWDISSGGAQRRQLRIWRESLLAQNDPRMGLLLPVRLAQVIDQILPPRGVRGRELQRLFYCTAQHVGALHGAGHIELEQERRVASGPHASRVFTHASIRRFLTDRVIGPPVVLKSPPASPLHPDSRN